MFFAQTDEPEADGEHAAMGRECYCVEGILDLGRGITGEGVDDVGAERVGGEDVGGRHVCDHIAVVVKLLVCVYDESIEKLLISDSSNGREKYVCDGGDHFGSSINERESESTAFSVRQLSQQRDVVIQL